MGFLNFFGGMGNIATQVYLKKMDNDAAKEVAQAKANTKASLKQAEETKVFKIGGDPNNLITFKIGKGLGDSASERGQAAVDNIITSMSPTQYKDYIKTANDDQKRSLHGFLRTQMANWLSNNKHTISKGATPLAVGWRNVLTYRPDLTNYGTSFAYKVIQPAYGTAIDRFKKYYPPDTNWKESERIVNDASVNVRYSPTAVINNPKYVELAKKYMPSLGYNNLNQVYSNLALQDKDLNDPKHAQVYDILEGLRNEVGVLDYKVENFAKYDILDKYRQQAQNLGLTNKQFLNMLKVVVPTADFFYNDNVVYSSQAERDNYTQGLLKSTYNIDIPKEAAAAQGAVRASGTAKSMVKKIDEVGDFAQPFANKIDAFFRIFTDPTGPLRSTLNITSSWQRSGTVNGGRSLDTNGNLKNAAATTAINKKLDNLNRAMAGDFSNNDIKSIEAAKLEFMKFQLAYEMASALQGGTGGRTISDQDVLNMLNAMKFNVNSPVRHIRASLVNISNIMSEIGNVKSFYASGSASNAFAAKLYQNLIGTYGNYESYIQQQVAKGTTDTNDANTVTNQVGPPNTPSNQGVGGYKIRPDGTIDMSL